MSPSSEIRGIATSLGVLAGQVDEDQWAFLSLVRENLYAQADVMEDIEHNTTLTPEEEQ